MIFFMWDLHFLDKTLSQALCYCYVLHKLIFSLVMWEEDKLKYFPNSGLFYHVLDIKHVNFQQKNPGDELGNFY